MPLLPALKSLVRRVMATVEKTSESVEYLEVAGSCGRSGIWPHRYGISGWTGEPHATDDDSANESSVDRPDRAAT